MKVAHLYEHLFCHTLSRLLRRGGLFCGLDYNFHGSTYSGSLIIISFTALNTGAEEILNTAAQLPFEFTAIDRLDDLIAELGAEEQSRVTYNSARLLSELEAIHNVSWERLEGFSSFNLRGGRRRSTALNLTPLARPTASRVTCEIAISPSLTKTDHNYLPAAYFLLNVLRSALGEEIVSTKYYYYNDETAHFKNATARMAVHFLRPSGAKDLASELQICRGLVDDMISHSFIERLNNIVSRLNEHARALAVAEDIVQQTGIFVGGIGIRHLVTKERILRLLEHTTVALKVRGEQRGFRIEGF